MMRFFRILCVMLFGCSALGGELENLRKSAAKGDLAAQYNLAVKYEFGFDVPKDEAKAAALFRKAHEQIHLWPSEAMRLRR